MFYLCRPLSDSAKTIGKLVISFTPGPGHQGKKVLQMQYENWAKVLDLVWAHYFYQDFKTQKYD